MSEKSLHAKKYFIVFSALMLLTWITVRVSNFHLGIAAAVALAMLIATIKGGLVGAFFMHLVGENKFIIYTLILTLIFLLILLFVPLLLTTTDYKI